MQAGRFEDSQPSEDGTNEEEDCVAMTSGETGKPAGSALDPK